jgi:superoxide reductase
LCGVNEPADKSDLQDLEKKHMPVIDAPDKVKKDEVFEVKITVGGIDGVDHPDEPGHFIEWLELYSGDTFLGRVSYSGGASLPYACFRVKLNHSHGPLKVWEKCNLHGLWENTRELEVE